MAGSISSSTQWSTVAYHGMSALNKFDVISSIGSAILLIVALGLVANYAVNPTPPMIHITAHLSFSLPFMVCSAAGVIFSLLFSIQLIRHKDLKIAFERGIGQLVASSGCLQAKVRYALHPARRRQALANCQTASHSLTDDSGNVSRSVNFLTRDHVKLQGYWRFVDAGAPTVIVFHGNGSNAEEMALFWGKIYGTLNYNFLCVEYRGFGLSDGVAGKSHQEMEAYFDAEAVLKFVLEAGVQKDTIIAHGSSLGGAYATALAHFYGIKFVILDHPFTSLAATIHHATPLSLGLAKQIVRASYLEQHAPKDQTIPDAKDLKTDGFDSLKKMHLSQSQLFVIQGKKDHLMSEKFGEQLIQAAYPQDSLKQQEYLTLVSKGHDLNAFFQDRSAQQKFLQFLRDNNLLISKD